MAGANAPPFARLHFFQMAAEKTCKAYLVRDNGYQNLNFSHCLILKTMPAILRDVLRRTQGWTSARISSYLRQVRPMLLEVECLAPACDAQASRPDNTEYPWTDVSGSVQIPSTFPFTAIDDRDRQVTQLIKLMRVSLAVLHQSM